MATFNGNNSNNVIKGTNSSDVINGGGGNDQLFGQDGNDWIYGGTGNDTIRGGDDRDRLYGEDGSDLVYGDAGDDFLYGGAGNDGVFGGDGNDNVNGGDGDDHLTGADGDDYLYGDAGNDHLEGDDGDDKLVGGAGNDKLEGGYGDDHMDGGDGDDTLFAGGGNNTLIGGAGNDVLSTDGYGAWLGTTRMYGGIGNDTYAIFKVSDSILVDDVVPQVIEYADGGTDLIQLGSSFFNEMTTYKMPDNVENLHAYRSPAAHLSSPPDEYVRVTGNGMDNIIIGTNEDDYLDGGDGNDTILSRQAADADKARADNGWNEDTLVGGKGNDRLTEIQGDIVRMYGGAGNDIFTFSDHGYAGLDKAQFAGWGAWEYANEGFDTVYSATASTFLADNVEALTYIGSAANTHLWGNALNNYINGGANSNDDIRGYDGDDVLDGGVGNGNDTIDGGNGVDIIKGWGGNDQLLGGAGNDIIYGGTGGDIMRGGTGNDELQGDDGADQLDGGDGNDYLIGGAGDDYIYGGLGADKAMGGAGIDIFVFNTTAESNNAMGIDNLIDFQHGTDKIDLRGIDANTNWTGVGDQAFTFRGTQGYSAGSTPGELVVSYENNNTVIRGDVNGDHVADFQVTLTGIVELTSSDFYL